MRGLAAILLTLWATAAFAQVDNAGEIRRGAEAVGLSSSEAPAVRQERAAREPSPGFLLGAAYRVWINAAAQLAFDLENPTAAGPAHASQNAALSDFIQAECREEVAAFANLEQRSKAAGLDPGALTAVLSAPAEEAALWGKRRTGPASACR